MLNAMKITLTGLFSAGLIFLSAMTVQAVELRMETSKGVVILDLNEKVAPNHTARFVELANRGFYDGIIFHRVIAGFMAQTGDPTGTGRGGSDLPDLKAEFSNEKFERGVIGMARSATEDSANSQFFIMFDEAAWLRGQYTVVGKVTKGMEFIDAINKGEPPLEADKIVKMTVK